VPVPFRWLNQVVVGDGVIAIVRDVYYGAGPGLGTGVWRLAAYAAAGLAATATPAQEEESTGTAVEAEAVIAGERANHPGV